MNTLVVLVLVLLAHVSAANGDIHECEIEMENNKKILNVPAGETCSLTGDNSVAAAVRVNAFLVAGELRLFGRVNITVTDEIQIFSSGSITGVGGGFAAGEYSSTCNRTLDDHGAAHGGASGTMPPCGACLYGQYCDSNMVESILLQCCLEEEESNMRHHIKTCDGSTGWRHASDSTVWATIWTNG